MKEIDRRIYFWQCVVWIIVSVALILALRDFGINVWFGMYVIFVIMVGIGGHFIMAESTINEAAINSKETYY